MKTTTGQAILNAAAEFAQRTRDKVPVQEQILLQGYIASEFQILINQRAWPDMIPAIVNVVAANGQFSKNEGAANEIGDVLDVMLENPQTSFCRRPRHAGFYEGDGVVFVETTATNLYVEYALPYPGVKFPDMDPQVMAAAVFMAQVLPLRFRNILARLAAGHLLSSDSNPAGAGVQYGLAEKTLAAEINRLPPEPYWRNTIRLQHPPLHRRAGVC